jgi:hypothetical protein
VQETEIELSIGETVQVGEFELTIVDVEADLIRIQLEPSPGHADVPVRFDMRRRPQPR